MKTATSWAVKVNGEVVYANRGTVENGVRLYGEEAKRLRAGDSVELVVNGERHLASTKVVAP